MLRYLVFFLLFILIPHGAANAAPRDAGVFSGDYGRVDLSGTLDFEAYAATGSDEQRKALDDRMNSCVIADFFEEEAKKIDYPVTILMIGMMYCPDCKVVYPYLEALPRVNPYIRTRYLARNDMPRAREFMAARAGRTNMPSVFVIRPDGSVADGAYVETPARVTDMLASAATDEERDAIWNDFHDGAYDKDVQSDLLKLVLSASRKQNASE
jgi:uncharacterized protein YbaR (Trm112 family)